MSTESWTPGWVYTAGQWRAALRRSDGTVWRNVGLYARVPGSRPVSARVAATFTRDLPGDPP